jgi:hypothetical protein
MLEAASSILLGKKMRIIKLIFLLLILAIGYLPVVTHAQNNPNNPLVIFVNNTPGTTMLQRAVGYAVADICPNLGGPLQPAGPQRDLFERCNEMIATACEFNDPTNPSCGRSLELSDPDELLAALQQVWGEELHSNSSLTTRVTNGQFANIAGRMNALRLGAASGAVTLPAAALAGSSKAVSIRVTATRPRTKTDSTSTRRVLASGSITCSMPASSASRSARTITKRISIKDCL